MDCLFCNKPARFEPIKKTLQAVMDVWRCPDCRAQFDYSKLDKKVIHINFFCDIHQSTYSIQLCIKEDITKIRKVSSGVENVMEIPMVKGLTPQNAAHKLKTWLIFS